MTALFPLDGIRVLDFTSNVSGPYATQILAELGADVIKVERPHGDDGRRLTPTMEGYSAVFEAVNRGKRSISVDLKPPAGRKLALDLAATVDIVVENMKPGTMSTLGLGFQDISVVNDDIIYLSISGFGQNGPLAGRPGYDMVMQARAGLISLTGDPERAPVRIGVSIVDFGTGPWAALSVVSALRLRDQGSKAQHLDLSLYDVAANWATLPLTQFTIAQHPPRRLGGQTAMGAPADIYPTAHGYLVVAVVNEPLWAKFCNSVGLEQLMSDPRFIDNAHRSTNREALSDVLTAHFASAPAKDWAERLQAGGVTAEEVVEAEALLDDPQGKARSTFLRVDHPVFGDVAVGVAPPVGVRDWQATGRAPSPSLGEHTVSVLSEFGLDDHRISELIAEGVIYE